jgi:nucleoside-diphosphate-sugar epimerase
MKLTSEQLLAEAFRHLPTAILILRLANVYGGTNVEGRYGLIDKLLQDKPINLMVKPTSTKQYGFYADYGANIIRLVNSVNLSSSSVQIRNLFPPHSYNIAGLINLFTSGGRQPKIAIDESGEYPEETVILQNHDSLPIFSSSWISVEEYVGQVLDD